MARAAQEPREDDVRSVGVPSARRLWVFFDVFCRMEFAPDLWMDSQWGRWGSACELNPLSLLKRG
ncbi:hypothetical protein Taro_012869 [Colocasia esculenta]|uniref:Uncharacterized protein n=1 Tax=Colocasia esculenta TaxID=4460 RepID=A0A843U540_COLES|nr:hypothetical protein [Colocasia esculenta]